MNRSKILVRELNRHIVSKNKTRNLFRAQRHFFSSHHNNHRQQHRQFPTAWCCWIAAAGSSVFFQIYDEPYHTIRHLTLTERQPDSSPSSSSETSTTTTAAATTSTIEQEKEALGEEETKKAPWYRRYPSQALERIRSPTIRRRVDYASDHEHSANSKDPPKDNATLFEGQCLQRQLYKPSVPYPAWDYNWDGKMLEGFSTLPVLSTPQGLTQSSCTGTTRHILLIRHGQYDEQPFDDRKRVLTPLGRRQAFLTGKRLGQLVQHIGADKFKAIYTSDMVRAKQTAWIMAKSMPDSIPVKDPDPDLAECLPAPMIPSRPDIPDATEEIDEQMERMDRAFRKYFYRADPPPELVNILQQLKEQQRQQQNSSSSQQSTPVEEPLHEPEYNISTSGTISMGQRFSIPHNDPQQQQQQQQQDQRQQTKQRQSVPFVIPASASLPPPNHEFDILVCHGNVIRYFVCRALQLPPETWLRQSVFNCSITYIIIKPNGYVSCRMIGDIGHLGYKEITFSGAHGLVWS